MYQVLTNIVIQQIPTAAFPDRNLQLTIPFVHSYKGSSSWADQTSAMTIVLPKNVKVTAKNANGDIYSLGSSNKILGGNVSTALAGNPVPTLLQGDMITFNAGYRTKLMGNGGNEITYMTGGPDPTGTYSGNIPPLFQGFIAKVSPRLPFTIECEDAMWLLKQINTGAPKQWTGDNIPSIVSQVLASDKGQAVLQPYNQYLQISVADYSAHSDLVFNIQDFWTHGESLAQVLARVNTEYQVCSWFRGYELRTGLTYYIPGEAKTQNFTFTQNILDDDTIEVKRMDDNVQSIDVKTTYVVQDSSVPATKDGQTVARKDSTEVLVYVDSTGAFASQQKNPNVDLQIDDLGRRHSWYLYGTKDNTNPATVDVTSSTDLSNIGVRILKKRYYNGLSGTFTTFGVPFVKHGDVINLVHPILPEVNGMYMCKNVEYSGGAEQGLRQTITLDFSIKSLDDIAAFS